MALQKNININVNGILEYTGALVSTTVQTFNNCYIKITNLSGNKDLINIQVTVYDTKGGKILNRKNYSFTPSVSDTSKNFIKQGYEYLKTLDEYKDAVDLLDEEQTA